MKKPPTPQGYRRVETHENVVSSDLYWSFDAKEWIMIGEHRVRYANEDRSAWTNITAWPNIIRLAAPEAKTEISGGSNAISVNGMSLRDWFAGQALAGLLANSHNYMDTESSTGIFYGEYGNENEVASDNAYWYADAMLKAREEKQC